MDEITHIPHFEAGRLKIHELLEARNVTTILIDPEADSHDCEEDATSRRFAPLLTPLLICAEVERTWHACLKIIWILQDFHAYVFIEMWEAIRVVVEQISDLDHVKSVGGFSEMSCLL